jgi:mannitol/fructose-specific phosphotransferase system IIA component (Ntr-type)
MMNISKGLSQARKGDIALYITEKGTSVTIKTSKNDMSFVKNEIYEIILELSETLQKLKTSADTEEMKKQLFDSNARVTSGLLSLIEPKSIALTLKGETKEEIITELVDMLAAEGKLLDRDQVLADVFEREGSMSTGMEFGVAIPHGKTDGIVETAVAVGIKKAGVNFGSMDGQPSRLFTLVVSPKHDNTLHIQFLAAIGAIPGDKTVREAVINAESPEEAVGLFERRR